MNVLKNTADERFCENTVQKQEDKQRLLNNGTSILTYR